MDHRMTVEHTGMNHASSMNHIQMNCTGHDCIIMMKHDDGEHDSSHTMHMFFTVSNRVTLFLDGLDSGSTGALIGFCFMLAVVSMLYEGLKVWRQMLLFRSTRRYDLGATSKTKLLSLAHFIQTLIHVIQVFVGYLLMLAFMTYNVWICIAVIIGSGIGYFMFAWKITTFVRNAEHCN